MGVKYSAIQKSATPVAALQIRYKGAWDMQDFYESVVSYLRERKFNFHEKVYKHKHPSPYGLERQYVWYAEQKLDEYMKVVMDIYIHTYDAHEIDIIDKNGQRKLMTEGKIWIVMKINNQWNVQEGWDKNSFWGQLKDFYIKYIVRRKIMEGYNPRSRSELTSLHQYMMHKLKMSSASNQYANIAGVHKRGP